MQLRRQLLPRHAKKRDTTQRSSALELPVRSARRPLCGAACEHSSVPLCRMYNVHLPYHPPAILHQHRPGSRPRSMQRLDPQPNRAPPRSRSYARNFPCARRHGSRASSKLLMPLCRIRSFDAPETRDHINDSVPSNTNRNWRPPIIHAALVQAASFEVHEGEDASWHVRYTRGSTPDSNLV